jgi:hypothetical protein
MIVVGLIAVLGISSCFVYTSVINPFSSSLSTQTDSPSFDQQQNSLTTQFNQELDSLNQVRNSPTGKYWLYESPYSVQWTLKTHNGTYIETQMYNFDDFKNACPQAPMIIWYGITNRAMWFYLPTSNTLKLVYFFSP